MPGGKINEIQKEVAKRRAVGRTEQSWCRAVSCGTGITVLSLQLCKPVELSDLQNVFQKLQFSHPILTSKLHYNSSKKSFFFITPSSPRTQIKHLDYSSTSRLLQTLRKNSEIPNSISPVQLIQEHEMNQNPWTNPSSFPDDGIEMFFASLYELPGQKWVVALRLHTAVCDRTTAISLLRELPELVGEVKNGGDTEGLKIERKEVGVNMAVEDMVDGGKTKKSLWAHGMDMLEYSVNSFRLTNLKFVDPKGPRSSAVVRLKISPHHTALLLAGCKSRDIKLCGAIAAAGLLAGHSTKAKPDLQKKKYGVATLTDCRSILDPPLTNHHFGFYHAAVLNLHSINGHENLWELATKCYNAFDDSKRSNKHISDLADLNFLMCKAIENPSLTPSSSLRTSLISVFEDPVFDHSDETKKGLGLEDYLGCASAHGVGPSIAVFDTIRDGQLDSACVYPCPLHSRQQMEELVDQMKTLLVDAATQKVMP